MRDELVYRQIALVSYGSKYLRGEIRLEDWHRHPALGNTRFQFRDHASNALLEDDFTWWLGILKLAGALRLSLHLPIQFSLTPAPAREGNSYVIVVHFHNRHELWIAGQEETAWSKHPLVTWQPDRPSPSFPDAACFACDLDSYWCVGQRDGKLDIGNTDWKALTQAIAVDLDIEIPSKDVTSGPVVHPPAQPDADGALPLFPYEGASALAHPLVATLAWQRERFAHDSDSRNDSSPIAWAAGDPTSSVYAWGKRLDSWIREVQLRCANEYRNAAHEDRHPHVDRLYTVAPVPQAPSVPIDEPAETLDQASMEALRAERTSAAETKATTGKRWIDRIGVVLALAVISLLVLAVANVIASFPWLALIIGAGVVIYGQLNKEYN